MLVAALAVATPAWATDPVVHPDPTSVETAALTPGEPGDEFSAELPRILGERDANLYRRIFALQKEGRWRAADRLIARLENRLLMGHVLFQRYMHPTKYRSRYVELKKWMQKYADHPGARRVYRLALRRQPPNWRPPKRPVGIALGRAGDGSAAAAEQSAPSKPRLSRAERRRVARIQRIVKSLVRRGRPTQALRLLSRKHKERRLDRVSYDEALTVIARGYYHAELDTKALSLAKRAAARSGDAVPMSRWWAGLAAWRLGHYEVSARQFEALARTRLDDAWLISAAAYWAARAYLRGLHFERVNRMLELAAKYPRTFYGLLATRALGIEPSFDWELPRIGRAEFDVLARLPAARRALALIQVGETGRAEAELRRFTGNLSPELARLLLGLAARANLPSLAYRLGKTMLATLNLRYDAALYPIPEWRPEEGFTVDRALIYALMRQESGFKPRAKSPAGARGLMQLMPGTARFVGGRSFRRAGRFKLFEPEYNMALGQRYVRLLLEEPSIAGNLFYAAAAYNGGPGNLNKWRRRTDYRNDPLLFIESIPARETRVFIERVLTNLWIYRYRLGQPAPSLNAVAAGTWPQYNGLDPTSRELASRGN